MDTITPLQDSNYLAKLIPESTRNKLYIGIYKAAVEAATVSEDVGSK